MSAPSRWLNWTPSERQVMEPPRETEPAKPSKTNSVGFDGSGSKDNPIIQPTDQMEPADPIIEQTLYTEPSKPTKTPDTPCHACHGTRWWVSIHGEVVCATCHPPPNPGLVRRWYEQPICERPPAQNATAPGQSSCPYTLPIGVKVLAYSPKDPPVGVTVCSVVTDVPKFIQHALQELDARLHHPVQIKAGDSVFDLLSKLADCGLELCFDWPPKGPIMGESPESEPSKPSKLPEDEHPSLPELSPHGIEITDEGIPF